MGLASAHRFLLEGARLVIADFNEQAGVAAVAEINQRDRISFIKADVASEADVEAMIAHAVATFGRLGVLFNHVGVGGAIDLLTETAD